MIVISLCMLHASKGDSIGSLKTKQKKYRMINLDFSKILWMVKVIMIFAEIQFRQQSDTTFDYK